MLLVAEAALGEEEKMALASVIDSGWITMGGRVLAFEEAFAGAHGADDAVAVSSCTAGLHLVLDALGIGPGDEVLVPSLTFVATVNAVLYVGATPRFVDLEALQRPHLSLADAREKLNARTRAVLVMHYAGFLVDMPAWRAFADAAGIALIEDAAHAVGTPGVGKLADACVFSFYGNKNMTTAEGGMILAAAPTLLERVRQTRSHGMTSTAWQRRDGNVFGYDVTALGYNYRMDELRAAIGLAQLARLDAWNAQRRVLFAHYRARLATLAPQLLIPFDEASPSSWHILPVILPETCDRDTVMVRLRDAGIQTTVHYPAVHRFSYHRGVVEPVTLPVTEAFANRELTLPLHPRLAVQDVDRITAVLADSLRF